MCVATVAISNVAPSVGAFQGKPGVQLSVEEQQGLNELNASLNGVVQRVNRVQTKYNNLVGVYAKNYRGPIGQKRRSLENQLEGIVSDLSCLNTAEMKGVQSFDEKKQAIDERYGKIRENLGHILSVLNNCELNKENADLKLRTNGGAQIDEELELNENVILEMQQRKCENDVWKYLNFKLNKVAVLVRQIKAAWNDEQSSYSPFKQRKSKKNEDGKRERELKQDDSSDNKKKKTEEVVKPKEKENLISNVDAKPQNGTKDAEVDFGLKFLNVLPKTIDKLNSFLQQPSLNDLNSNRKVKVLHMDGSTETVDVDEVKMYDEIGKIVEKIVEDVNKDTTSTLSKEMRISEEIYKWVYKNIEYDKESTKNFGDCRLFRKLQDALFVYKTRKGVCEGISNLVVLMMRIAKIPSSTLLTLFDSKTNTGHAYTVINWQGLNNTSNLPKGWTLLDATWAGSAYRRKSNNPQSDEMTCFPGFYNYTNGLDAVNKTMLQREMHSISSFFGPRLCGKSVRSSQGFEHQGVRYSLEGTDGDAHIELSGLGDVLAENVQIPAELSNLPLTFKVLGGIKSFVLNGDQAVNISKAFDLESINIGNSKKYIVKNEKLYERDEKGQPGKEIASFDKDTRANRKKAMNFFEEIALRYGVKYKDYMLYLFMNKIDPEKVGAKHNRVEILNLKKELEEGFDVQKIDISKLKSYDDLVNTDIDAFRRVIDGDKISKIAKTYK